MRRTSRSTGPRLEKTQPKFDKTAARVAILGASVLLIAGLGIAVEQDQKAKAQAAEAAKSYEPAVTYRPPPDTTEIAFLGDSFTAGAGATDDSRRWTTIVAQMNGARELNYGYGGTNFATAGDVQGGRPYADRTKDIVASNPETIIVSSAGNTLDQDQQTGIKETFRELRNGLPNARIVATSPYPGSGNYSSEHDEFAAEIRAGVEVVDGEYLDLSDPLNDHPEAMDKDGTHPNDAGHQLIAEAVNHALE